jgi:hypothetical protein
MGACSKCAFVIVCNLMFCCVQHSTARELWSCLSTSCHRTDWQFRIRVRSRFGRKRDLKDTSKIFGRQCSAHSVLTTTTACPHQQPSSIRLTPTDNGNRSYRKTSSSITLCTARRLPKNFLIHLSFDQSTRSKVRSSNFLLFVYCLLSAAIYQSPGCFEFYL